jgi:hypothetical protein
MEGLLVSPAGGWVTSAPRKITGSRNKSGLHNKKYKIIKITGSWNKFDLRNKRYKIIKSQGLRISTVCATNNMKLSKSVVLGISPVCAINNTKLSICHTLCLMYRCLNKYSYIWPIYELHLEVGCRILFYLHIWIHLIY